MVGQAARLEGFPCYAAVGLARQILGFERNLAFQREALMGPKRFQMVFTRFDDGSAVKAAR